MNPEPQLTGGTIATVICVPLLLLIIVVAFVALRVWAAKEERSVRKSMTAQSSRWSDYRSEHALDDVNLARRWSWAAPVLIVVVVAMTWWFMYPWKSEYHYWMPKSGTVARVDSRMVSTGDKSMETKFVVMFTGDDQQYGVLDTRAAGVKTGDTLTITCKREWQFSGTDGYDCNFVSLERK